MSILLNNTSNNSPIIEIFINSLMNFNYNYSATKTYQLNLYIDASNNQCVEGTMEVIENRVSTIYTKKQQFNYSTGIISDNDSIQNFAYIIENLTIPIDEIIVSYNSQTYKCDKSFTINDNKYYILNPM